LLLVFARTFGQKEGGIVLSGQVTDEDGKLLVGVHVIDRNTISGTVTNRYGKYRLKADNRDTVYFSFLGFKTLEFNVPENLKEGTLKYDVQLVMDTILLKSTVVYPFPADANALMKDLLTLEIPDTAHKVDMHLEMVPIIVEIDMDKYRPGELNLFSFGSVISNVYDAVSHEGKMKRKYQQLLEHDRINELAAARLTDSLIMRATGLVEKEAIDALRQYCNLQPEFVVESSDYELYVAIIDCFKSFSQK
jgi:hypothetical protein